MNLLPLACIWFLFSISFATSSAPAFNLTIDSATCIAPSEFNTCWASAVAAESSCITIAGNDQEAILGCGCAGFVEEINCFASACWNRIYGCEYQSLVAEYFGLCPIASTPVPYWPAPDNAPGSCSCNTGKVLEAYVTAESDSIACEKNATSLTTVSDSNYIAEMDHACSCCATGVTISAMYDICPNTDPKLIGLNLILSAVAPFEPWPACGPSFEQFNCVNDLQFEAPLSTGSIYNPTDLPASGTQTLSNIAGEVTSPASGAVFTYSAVGSDWTVTALSIHGKQAASTTKTAAGTLIATQGGLVSTGTATVSAGGSSGSDTSTMKNSVDKIELSHFSALLALIVCGLMFVL